MSKRSYTDEDLVVAVASAHSWRGVLRALGLMATSAGSARSVRRQVDRLGLSYAHFTGQRSWSDSALAAAVGKAGSWSEVATILRLVPAGGTLGSLRSHAYRLGLATDHLDASPPQPTSQLIENAYLPTYLRDAGSLFAATWFTLRGAKVSWPLEPCRYDLIADLGETVHRVQVKTTSRCGPTAVVQMSNT